MSTKVVVGMSGGVDSSVSALLLKQQGYDVCGVFMKNWEEDDDTEYCQAAADLADAQAVCDKINMPLHTINFAAEYWDRVFEHFLAEYQAGRTPNPDILCNREIKFKAFLEYARHLGGHYIATGHYAGKHIADNRCYLRKATDANKDQSYFLYAISEAQLAASIFPLANLEKPQVRQIAQDHGLITHSKKDSTGICFIGERKFQDFLNRYLPAQPGEILDDKGNYLGQHHGIMFYTIGQRQGLGIGGQKNADEQPWYIASKDIAANRLIAVQGNNHPLLCHHKLYAQQTRWINDTPCHLEQGMTCKAKIRYRQADQKCQVTMLDQDQLLVEFDQPQRAVTPGQSIVFYQEDTCLGGAIITGAKL